MTLIDGRLDWRLLRFESPNQKFPKIFRIITKKWKNSEQASLYPNKDKKLSKKRPKPNERKSPSKPSAKPKFLKFETKNSFPIEKPSQKLNKSRTKFNSINFAQRPTLSIIRPKCRQSPTRKSSPRSTL